MTTSARQVPFLDLGAAYRELQPEIDRAVSSVLASGWYVLGAEVERFEEEFARYCGAKHCVGVANGLDALRLSLSAAGVGPGDEVIVPSNTFIATWLAVTHVGATPVPCEPASGSFSLDPRSVQALIGPRTRAILPVHLYGMPADMDPLRELARRHGLFLLDDAAQAHGATYEGRRVGALADATAWSFYPGKNLGAFGDAGAVTTNDTGMADRLRVLRNYGSRRKYENETIGWNSRLDPVQAAVLRVKLQRLDDWNSRRRDIARLYRDQLADLAWLRLPKFQDDKAVSSLHLFVIRAQCRDTLREHFTSNGIQTLIHYPIPPHLQPAYNNLNMREGSLPVSERLHAEVLSLPIGPHLERADAQRVVDVTRVFESEES